MATPELLVVDLVALWPLPGLGLRVLGGMRLAGASAACLGVRILAERLTVRVGRVARVLALLVRVWPLGRVRFAHGVVKGVMGISVLRAVTLVRARSLGKAGRRVLPRLVVAFVAAWIVHPSALPE
jgi:hypothetical protein